MNQSLFKSVIPLLLTGELSFVLLGEHINLALVLLDIATKTGSGDRAFGFALGMCGNNGGLVLLALSDRGAEGKLELALHLFTSIFDLMKGVLNLLLLCENSLHHPLGGEKLLFDRNLHRFYEVRKSQLNCVVQKTWEAMTPSRSSLLIWYKRSRSRS